MSTRSVTVEIAGLQLPVRTTASPEDVSQVESIVNDRLRVVQKSALSQPLHNHLALVAMSLAQELLTATRDQERFREASHALAVSLLESMDDDDA